MSPLVEALCFVTLAVGVFLAAVRRAQWLSWLPRGPETPETPRNLPAPRRPSPKDELPQNVRIAKRDDRRALERYATVARERRGYLALTGVTALMALVFGGCGFLPPAVRTTHIETPTISGTNAVTSATEVGGVISSVRVTVPPSNIRDCANFLDEAVPPVTATTHAYTAMYITSWRLQMRLLCLRQGTGGYGLGMGPNMLGVGAFPGGLRFKGGER